MTAAISGASRPARAPLWRRNWQLSLRRGMTADLRLALALALLSSAITVAVLVFPDHMPLASLMLPLLLGSLFLGPRTLPWFVIYDMVLLTVAFSQQEVTGPVVAAVGVQFLMGLIVLLTGFRRARLGVAGARGESMLVDLRDRLRAQGSIPLLPRHWHIETVLRSAYGDSFSGDFLVATRSTNGASLQITLVDVSGKGQSAGTRALLLSGAFGGLLGAMGRIDFLPAANAYLLRQRWDEGFATAVHLIVETDSGDYQLASAGHPPSAHFHAGSGRWELLDGPHGPALGVLETEDYPAHVSRLERGDALLMYTDGLVETPGRDLGLGIDRLMGQAERVVQRGGFHGGASRIVDGTRSGESDDRALVLLWRE